MAKIYSPPAGYDIPDYTSYKDTKAWLTACDRQISRLVKVVKETYGSKCPEAGEMISFPVGDGKASYIVVSLKPVKLIHIPNGDNYHFQYIHRLTASDIRAEVRNAQAIHELFKKG